MPDIHCDVVVVGSGAGGMVSAIRAHDLGLKPIVIEKAEFYGGTSAVSGGAIWVPCNEWVKAEDAEKKALDYLKFCTEGRVSEDRLNAYIKYSAELVHYLDELGVHFYVDENNTYPDYYPHAPGALPKGRTMYVETMDGGVLGDELYHMRESLPEFKIFDRLSVSISEAGLILARAPGWRSLMAKLLFNYWTDFSYRRKSRRDRRLNIGNALVGGLRKAMMDRRIPLYLQTRMEEVMRGENGVSGILANNRGRRFKIHARRGVILACGGFEQSQELREKYFPQPTQASWSVTPREGNTGDGLKAAVAIGADTEFLDEAWWTPTFSRPIEAAPQSLRSAPVFFERAYPHSLCVNRLAKRFVNESCSYHQFGQAMIEDNKRTGANIPCWIIFDSRFRSKYPMGGLLPSYVMPDSSLPPHWLDKLVYRAGSLSELAKKISLDPESLQDTVRRFNRYAENGVDEEFGRGSNVYDQYFGDPTVKPNRCMGPVSEAPFYAIRLELGDIGSKGGPKVDAHANVLDTAGLPIPGLYAVGNVAGSITAGSYPGAGATLGAAMTFGYIAANHIAGANS